MHTTETELTLIQFFQENLHLRYLTISPSLGQKTCEVSFPVCENMVYCLHCIHAVCKQISMCLYGTFKIHNLIGVAHRTVLSQNIESLPLRNYLNSH